LTAQGRLAGGESAGFGQNGKRCLIYIEEKYLYKSMEKYFFMLFFFITYGTFLFQSV
jgi:hypothetical protein